MTLSEYYLRLEAKSLQDVEKEYFLAKQAWNNITVQNCDPDTGKSEYHSFEQFFDYQSAIDNVRTQYEEGYKPKAKKKINKQDIFIQRIKEFKKLHPRKGEQ